MINPVKRGQLTTKLKLSNYKQESEILSTSYTYFMVEEDCEKMKLDEPLWQQLAGQNPMIADTACKAIF